MSGWPSACLGRDETEKIKQTSTAGWTYRFWHCGFLFFRRQVGQRDLRLFQIFKNKKPETGQRDSAVTVHEAVVSHFHEACWQDMLEEASDEFQGFKSDLAGAITSFLAIGEGDVSIFDSHDSGIGDGYPEDIGGEVFQGRLAVAYGLTVDVPGYIPDTGVDFVEQPLPCHLVFEFGPEYFGKRSDRQVEVISG